jgi:hypothetical protein
MSASLSSPVLVVSILAVWRVTHLLWGEDGPGDIFVRLRRLAGHGFWGSLLDCFYCLSLWVAAPVAFYLGGSWPERVLFWAGLSGGAILLERFSTSRTPPPAIWHEEPRPGEQTKEDETNAMLR